MTTIDRRTFIGTVGAAVLAARPAFAASIKRVGVQLYTVRSRRNWGIGDFADLKTLVGWLAPRGAAFIGLNPLHALAPADPAQASPYSASSRHFLNILYIAVTNVPELADCEAAQARIGEPSFEARLRELRRGPLVDYAGVVIHLYGELGLAPGWRNGQLDLNGQEAISACLMASTNGTGKHVNLEMNSAQTGPRGSSNVYKLGKHNTSSSNWSQIKRLRAWISERRGVVPKIHAVRS